MYVLNCYLPYESNQPGPLAMINDINENVVTVFDYSTWAVTPSYKTHAQFIIQTIDYQ